NWTSFLRFCSNIISFMLIEKLLCPPSRLSVFLCGWMNFFSISSSRRTSYDEEMKNFFFISSSWRTSCDEEMKNNFFSISSSRRTSYDEEIIFSFLHHEDVHDEETKKKYFFLI